jgi:SM-20-related protein
MNSENSQLLWDEKQTEAVGERIAEGLAASSYAVIDRFLEPSDVICVRAHIDALLALGGFKQAGIGSARKFQVNQDIRKDWIHWLDGREETTRATLGAFILRLQKLMEFINRSCFLGLKDFEMHYAVYPPGAFYKRHLDQFKDNDHRRLTFLCYLNEAWESENGGQLRLYIKSKEAAEEKIDILPTAGRLVVFRSDELEHEVLVCNRQRYSLTGWMLDQFKSLTFLK